MLIGELLTKLGFKVDTAGLDSGMKRARSAVTEFKSFLGKLTLGYTFIELGKTVLKTASDLETMTAQFTTMLGSSEKAAELMQRLRGYAIRTTFTTPQLAQSLQMLVQYHMPLEQAWKTMQQLGDVAGASQPRFNRLAYAMAEVNSNGRLQAKEMRQLAMAGWNPLRSIMDMTGKSMEELRDDMKHGKISADMVLQALEQVTGKSGMFYMNQARQATTWAGVTSNAWENLVLNAADALQKLLPIVKSALVAIASLPMSWLGDVFTKVSDALYYMGHIFTEIGVVRQFQILRSEIVEWAGAWSSALVGSRMAGNSIQVVSTIIGYLILNLVRAIGAVIQFTTYIARTISWLKEHKAAVIAVAIALMIAFGPVMLARLFAAARGVAAVTTAMRIFNTVMKATRALMLAWTLGGGGLQGLIGMMKTLPSLFGNAAMGAKIFGVSLMTTLGPILVMVGVIIADLKILNDTLSENKDLQDTKDSYEKRAKYGQQAIDDWNAMRQAQRAGDTKTADAMYRRNRQALGMVQAETDRYNAAHPKADGQSDFEKFSKQMHDDAEKQQRLMEQQLAEQRKAAQVENDKNRKLELKLKHSGSINGNMPADVLQLYERHIRSNWTMTVQRALAEGS